MPDDASNLRSAAKRQSRVDGKLAATKPKGAARQREAIHRNQKQGSHGGCEAGPSRRRQPSDREGRRRRPRAGLHRGHAGLETRHRAPSRRAHRAQRARVRKAVKWNSPFYGIEGQGWFLAFHVFTHYVKVTFFRGTSLRPVPPGGTGKDARWIDIHEDDLDEAQMATWVKQAAAIPGWGKS